MKRSLRPFASLTEIVLDIARKAGWHADKTITDKGMADKIGVLERDYDIIGFSLYHQLQYLNIVPILKSYGIPLLTYDRTKSDPLVCAGGAAVTSNPFPVADFPPGGRSATLTSSSLAMRRKFSHRY